MTPFLEKTEKALCVWLEHEMQKWLSVIGVAVREKTITVEAGLKTVSEVQESGIQGPCNAPGHPQDLGLTHWIIQIV